MNWRKAIVVALIAMPFITVPAVAGDTSIGNDSIDVDAVYVERVGAPVGKDLAIFLPPSFDVHGPSIAIYAGEPQRSVASSPLTGGRTEIAGGKGSCATSQFIGGEGGSGGPIVLFAGGGGSDCFVTGAQPGNGAEVFVRGGAGGAGSNLPGQVGGSGGDVTLVPGRAGKDTPLLGEHGSIRLFDAMETLQVDVSETGVTLFNQLKLAVLDSFPACDSSRWGSLFVRDLPMPTPDAVCVCVDTTGMGDWQWLDLTGGGNC